LVEPASVHPVGDYLSFDYGSVRIGIALGNTRLGTAQPLGTLSNSSGTPDWTQIDLTVKEWQPAGLVVGIPLTLGGEAQEITHHARGFSKRLKKRYALPVFHADEQFSSMETQREMQKMRARGQHGKTQHADIDKLAAAIILERWFATQHFSSDET